MARKPFERSKETEQLIAYLRLLEKGAEVSYAELTKIVGVEIVARTPKLTTARRILRDQHNAVWSCVRPGVGLRRLNDIQIAERLPAWWLRGATSKLRNGGKDSDVVDMKALDIDQQATFAVDVIRCELAQDALSKATKRKMERVARGSSNDLPSFTAVEWAISLSPRTFKKGSGI